jgi:hypothetical protein
MERVDLHLGDGDEVEDVAPVSGEDLSGGGEHDAAALAFGEREPDLALQSRQLHRDRRRAQVQLIGDGSDRAEPLQLGEHLEAPDFQHIKEPYASPP